MVKSKRIAGTAAASSSGRLTNLTGA